MGRGSNLRGGDGGDTDMNLFNDGERELAQEALLRRDAYMMKPSTF